MQQECCDKCRKVIPTDSSPDSLMEKGYCADEDCSCHEIEVVGSLLGFKYGIRAPLSTRVLSPEEIIKNLLSALKNTMLLRLKYPKDTDMELHARMQKGDDPQIEMTI